MSRQRFAADGGRHQPQQHHEEEHRGQQEPGPGLPTSHHNPARLVTHGDLNHHHPLQHHQYHQQQQQQQQQQRRGAVNGEAKRRRVPSRRIGPDGAYREPQDYFLEEKSKEELKNMVIALQAENRHLKNQIRCLTGLGMLADRVERLVGQTDALLHSGTCRDPVSPSHSTASAQSTELVGHGERSWDGPCLNDALHDVADQTRTDLNCGPAEVWVLDTEPVHSVKVKCEEPTDKRPCPSSPAECSWGQPLPLHAENVEGKQNSPAVSYGHQMEESKRTNRMFALNSVGTAATEKFLYPRQQFCADSHGSPAEQQRLQVIEDQEVALEEDCARIQFLSREEQQFQEEEFEMKPLQPLDVKPIKTEFITMELLWRFKGCESAQKFTNKLLSSLYTREFMASHSITGTASNKEPSFVKPALPSAELMEIIRVVLHFFPMETDTQIKSYIRQKLQNESKGLRKQRSSVVPSAMLAGEPPHIKMEAGD
uniref:BEN domain-containing protein 6 isoform X1 n=1 Tax=Petromyzon marinus TaxID=7757 RepID=A0AAJ7SYH2_PETMA|nr:BEN domain-containing protein 6 isoform X1 [Petromyzon marinus]